MDVVLVTGASTGIGFACADLLARNNFTVFAGVRTEADAQRLACLHENVRPVTLDVCNSEQIDAAAKTIRSSGMPLAGLVNNAGIALGGPLEYLPLDALRKQFEVNFFGAFAVTLACLPMLRAARGRIVMMSSVSGEIAPPFVGPYSASKFALEAMSDSLRMELAPSGIRVSVIQPGNVKTPIWQKGRERRDEMLARLPAAALEHYGAQIDALMALTEHEERTGIEASLVADTVLHALAAQNPRTRYPVGSPPPWQRRIATLMPDAQRDRAILKRFNA